MSGARPDTWMPWYIGDYLRKTMHLDAEEDGAYRRLIDATWVRGGVLRATDKEMAAITKLPLKRWLAIKSTIAEFFQISEEGWRQDRVSQELAKADAIVAARSAGGKRTAEKRWGNPQASSSNEAEQVAELPLSVLQSGRPSPPQPPPPSPEKEKNTHPRSRSGLSVEELQEFNEFYHAYPRKEDRGHAETAFLKARKIASLQQLVSGAQAYARRSETTERRYVALPGTWLNGKRWQDEPAGESVNGTAVSERRKPRMSAEEAERQQRLAEGIQ